MFKVVKTPDTELFFLHPVGCVKRKGLIILKGSSADAPVLGTTEYVKEKSCKALKAVLVGVENYKFEKDKHLLGVWSWKEVELDLCRLLLISA